MKYYITRKNRDLNEQFDTPYDFFRSFFGGSGSKWMRTDVKETENEFVLDIDLPGFEKQDISLKMEKGNLIVSASREEQEGEQNNYVARERSMQCTRSYYLGEVDEKNVKAKYVNGVLTVTVPKQAPEENVHKIDIE